MTPSATKEDDENSGTIRFIINGETHTLGPDVALEMTLLEYVRDVAHLRGTKMLCLEGGCGVCTVVVSKFDLETKASNTSSIRSCQTLVHSCAGWIITTIEHLGNSKVGYNRLQIALKEFYGTQCGYCSPGFIMTMHDLLQKSPDLTMSEIEKSFDGNLCRCTGYRPILDAFKSFAKDATPNLKDKLVDIEEAYVNKCNKNGTKCPGTCKSAGKCSSASVTRIEKSIKKEQDGSVWYRPQTVQEVLEILDENRTTWDKVRIVVGNTGQGVFKTEGPFDTFINTSGISKLYKVRSPDQRKHLYIGANVSLNRCIDVFHEVAKNHKGFHHLEQVAEHWEVVANTGVRNAGCWAGNLAMKHKNRGFTSDIFTTLIAVEAKIRIISSSKEELLCLDEFLVTDMSASLIVAMEIPPQPTSVLLRTFKITPRAVNAHAYVNAAFKLHLDPNDGHRVVNMPIIALAGINPQMIRAYKTEKFLVGKQLRNSQDLERTIGILGEEVKPDALPQDATPKYRRILSQSLLYKTALSILGDSVDEKVISGGPILERPLSSGKQEYDANKDTWPIGEAMPKLESEQQLSGEAEYLDDIAPLPTELFGVFVQTTIAKGTIKAIHVEDCLNYPGVVDFITVKDIPGKNTFTATFQIFGPDPVFADKNVQYAGQAIGLVVAKSKIIAKTAAKLIKVDYDDITRPVITIKESIEKNRVGNAFDLFAQSTDPVKFGDIQEGFNVSDHTIEGELHQGSQFHLTMEPMAARVVPLEDGFDVFCTSQWQIEVGKIVSNILQVPAHRINMYTKRIGGGYGAKVTRPAMLAAAAAVAAYKLNKPVRVTLTMEDQMTLIGWREPYYSSYKVGFNSNGELQSVKTDIYADSGLINNECSSSEAAQRIPNTYHCPHWLIQAHYALTDTATNTYCRAPGITEGIATMENILEHIADFLNLDPLVVRERNLITESKLETTSDLGDKTVSDRIFPLLKKSSQIESRRIDIDNFNKNNRWKKKGIAMIPIHYPIHFPSMLSFNVHVVIHEHDGTVAIKHGGIEMGQGINTKVAQVAAKTLGIPLDLIQVKATDNFSGANSFASGGSMASDLNAHGVKLCCEKIKERMNVVAQQLKEKEGKQLSWTALVKTCFMMGVDICERYQTFGKEHPKSYDVWASAVVEVEVDVLTGQFLVLRADIMEDCGRSLSPQIDIGQIEGGFLMGLGFFTSEKVKFNPETGQKLSNGTWEYKPPTALDIPIDFRVILMPKGDNVDAGVVRSKATGEPAVCLSYVVVAALRHAIKSARQDTGLSGWFNMHTPITVEEVHRLCNVQPDHFQI